MDTDNLMLVIGAYADAGAAADDFKALKAGQDAGEYEVVGAVVMNRDASGNVDVQEHGDGRVGGGAVLGGTAGLVVGLFAPPLLAAGAIGAGIGAGIGALKKLAARGGAAVAAAAGSAVVAVSTTCTPKASSAAADQRVDSGDSTSCVMDPS